MKPQGRRVTCGCVMPHHLSVRQVSWLSFKRGLVMGLTFGAVQPLDWRERENREFKERMEHLLTQCPRFHRYREL